MPFTNFCNRLVVREPVGCPTPNLRSSRSVAPRFPSDPPDRACARPLEPNLPRRCWLAIAGITNLGEQHGWRRSCPCDPLHHQLGGLVIPGHDPCWRCRPPRTRWVDHKRLLSCLSPNPLTRAARQDQDPFHNRRTNVACFPSPKRLPSTGPAQPPRTLARADRSGRHWYPGLATEGPASNMRSRPETPLARPTNHPAVRRRPRATCCLPTSPNWAIHEHTEMMNQTSPPWVRQPKLPRRRVTMALASHRQPSFLRPGVCFRSVRSQPPPRRPRAAMDLPQPGRPGHLLSPTRAHPDLERRGRRPCGYGLEMNRTSQPGFTAPLRATHPVGPPCPPPREKETNSAAPEVPSTPGSSASRPKRSPLHSRQR